MRVAILFFILVFVASASQANTKTQFIKYENYLIPVEVTCNDNLMLNGSACADIVTWNILAESAEAGGNLPWPTRKAAAIERLLQTKADIIGLQEVSSEGSQFNDVKIALSDKYNLCEGLTHWWLGIKNPIFIRKGISYQCLTGFYNFSEANGHNCNLATIDGRKHYNCHFTWRWEGNENLRAAQKFTDVADGSYVLMGDLNTALNHPDNSASAQHLLNYVDWFTLGSGVDKIAVRKGRNLCLVDTDIDHSVRPGGSDHPLVSATVVGCN